MANSTKRWLTIAAIVILAGVGYYAWRTFADPGLPEGIASGNGRIEATEIDIAAKIAGRIRDILVREGDFVTAGQILVHMNTDQLEARRRQAQAELRRALIGVDTSKSLVIQRDAERKAAVAVIAQREAEFDAANRRLERSQQLVRTNTVSQQVLDDDRASAQGASAAVNAAKAQLAAADAAVSAAKAQVVDAEAAVEAARAAIETITADIDDSTLTSPRDGRVQFRVAQPGEVLAAGGRVLNMVDLSDVYMTFFLPTPQAGRVAIGSEARLVLDAWPQAVIPARVSFVANVAQFTPKTVETTQEREKLMFRIRAQIPEELLRKHIEQVKTGLPGMAYVRLDPNTEWPERLSRVIGQ